MLYNKKELMAMMVLAVLIIPLTLAFGISDSIDGIVAFALVMLSVCLLGILIKVIRYVDDTK